MTDISGRFFKASITGAALMKLGRAPTTQITFMPVLPMLLTRILRSLSPEIGIARHVSNGPDESRVIEKAECKGGGGPTLSHSQSRQSPPCERQPIAHRLRHEQVGEPSFHQRQVAEQQRDESEGSSEPTQLVRDVLKEQTVAPGRDEVWTQSHGLIISGQRPDLTPELLLIIPAHLVEGESFTFERYPVASHRNAHRDQDIVEDGSEWQGPEQLSPDRVDRSRGSND